MTNQQQIIKELQTKNLVDCQNFTQANKLTEEEWAEIKEAIVANLEKNVEGWTIKEIPATETTPSLKVKVIVHASAQIKYHSQGEKKVIVDLPRMFAQESFTKEQWQKINQVVPNFVEQTPPSNWDWGTIAVYGLGGAGIILALIFIIKWIKSKS